MSGQGFGAFGDGLLGGMKGMKAYQDQKALADAKPKTDAPKEDGGVWSSLSGLMGGGNAPAAVAANPAVAGNAMSTGMLGSVAGKVGDAVGGLVGGLGK